MIIFTTHDCRFTTFSRLLVAIEKHKSSCLKDIAVEITKSNTIEVVATTTH